MYLLVHMYNLNEHGISTTIAPIGIHRLIMLRTQHNKNILWREVSMKQKNLRRIRSARELTSGSAMICSSLPTAKAYDFRTREAYIYRTYKPIVDGRPGLGCPSPAVGPGVGAPRSRHRAPQTTRAAGQTTLTPLDSQ